MKYKKDSIALILLIVFIILFFIACVYGYFYFTNSDIDFCLDTGRCKEGLEINTEYGLVKINKENCLKYNWSWDDNYSRCHIR